MNNEIKKDTWLEYFKDFNEKNHLRPAKFEVFDDMGTQTEVNILPFSGIDLELKGEDSPIVNLSFGDDRADGRHLSHDLYKVNNISIKYDEYGNDEVLELETDDKVKVLIIFEKLVEIGSN
jgi:hypothetical protein